MAKYVITVQIPMLIPQEAVDQLKEDVKKKIDELVAKYGEYEVRTQVRQQTAREQVEEEEKVETKVEEA